ncbi:MAG TPA: FAD-dependent oxidoreductase [Ktedonobacteraceae bacterium]
MKTTSDVIIVGAGIVGCMLAYWLRKSGRSVLLFERGQPGQEASGAYAGLLSPAAEGHVEGPYASLSRQGLAALRETVAILQDETGLDAGLACAPLFRVATSKQEGEVLYQYWQKQRTLGGSATWLEASEVLAAEPAFSPRIIGAMRSPEEYHLMPRCLLPAVVAAGQLRGVRMLAGTAVSRLLTRGQRVIGVEAGGTIYQTEQVVLASGAWSPALLQPLGLELAVAPKRGQMLTIVCPDFPLAFIVNTAWGYLVPKSDRSIVVGATQEDAGFVKAVTMSGIAQLLRVLSVLPPLMHATLQQTFTGLRPMSADGMPLLGPVPGWEGLCVATGHSQHGILLSDITARMVTAHLNGENPGEHWADFQVARALTPGKDHVL